MRRLLEGGANLRPGANKRKYGILYKTRHVLNRSCLRQLYFSFINSYLNYGNIAWASTNKTKLKCLHRRQKHAARIIYLKNKFTHSKLLLTDMKALDIYGLNLLHTLCSMYKYLTNQTPKAFNNLFSVKENKYTTRSDGSYSKPFRKTKLAQFSISYRGSLLWNKYSSLDKKINLINSFPMFKSHVKKLITSSNNVEELF